MGKHPCEHLVIYRQVSGTDKWFAAFDGEGGHSLPLVLKWNTPSAV